MTVPTIAFAWWFASMPALPPTSAPAPDSQSAEADSGGERVKPKLVTQTSGAASESSTPSDIAMTYDQSGITLGECTSYLHLATSEAACTFTRSSANS